MKLKTQEVLQYAIFGRLTISTNSYLAAIYRDISTVKIDNVFAFSLNGFKKGHF